MKYFYCLFVVCTCWLLFAAAACTSAANGGPGETALLAEVLRTGQYCLPAANQWKATWISSPESFRKMIEKCSSNRIGAAAATLPPVDFEHFGVLAVEMGEQPSAGYSFDKSSVTARLLGQTAIVTVKYLRPAPGAMTAQVMTAPWILIRLPAGVFRHIRVVDSEGRTLAQTETF